MAEATPSVETTQPRFTTLNDYENWGRENWLYTLGTDEAQYHVRYKLDEEVRELSEALEQNIPDEIKTELGDVLWTSTAIAINEGFEAQGEPISLAEIDKIANEGHTEWDVPVLQGLYGLNSEEISRRIKAGDTEMTKQVMESLAHQLGKAGRMTRKLGDQLDYLNGKHNTFGSAWVEVQHQRLVNARAQILILGSFIAQSKLGLSLADVMQANYDKLSARISGGEPVTK